jgi:ribosomal-protein-alanine N-acetyltransferase
VNLRPTTPDDVAALAALHAASFDHPWSAQEIGELLTAPGGFGVVVEDAGVYVGFLLGRAAAGEAEVLTVAVASARRGAGLGAALVEAGCGLARAVGAEAVFLEVAVDNAPALRLYERAGFAKAGYRPRYYRRPDGGPIDALVLRRDLTA